MKTCYIGMDVHRPCAPMMPGVGRMAAVTFHLGILAER